MNRTSEVLTDIRDYLISQNDIKKMLSDELKLIVSEDYDGNFSEFMKREVLNEDYGALRNQVEELYWNEFYLS